MTNIIITGADGQLGTEIRGMASDHPGFRFIYTDIGSLDICSEEEVGKLIRTEKPDFIVNCAGYTMVDRAEEEIEKAMLVNGYAVGTMVSELERYGGRLLQISTDYVFDGERDTPYPEDYPPVPLSVYGRSKLTGEEMALLYDRAMIIRTSWLYSSYGNNFVKTISRIAGERKKLTVVDDQVGSPTWARDLAGTLLNIIEKHTMNSVPFRGGIYNFSNEGSCSWFGFASEIVNYLGLGTEIIPVTTSEYPQAATRPEYSVLDKTKIRETYGIFIPDWKDSLHKCLDILKANQNE